MNKKLLTATLYAVLAVLLMGMMASCADTDYVSPDQVDARVDARWNTLADVVNQKIATNERGIAQLETMLTTLQTESEKAHANLRTLIDEVANESRNYADYLAEQTRTSAIDAAAALVEKAREELLAVIANLPTNSTAVDLTELYQKDQELTNALVAAQARIDQLEAMTTMLDHKFSNAVDNLTDSIFILNKKTASMQAMLESQQAAIEANNARMASLEASNQALIDRIANLEDHTLLLHKLTDQNAKDIDDMQQRLTVMNDSLAEVMMAYIDYVDKMDLMIIDQLANYAQLTDLNEIYNICILADKALQAEIDKLQAEIDKLKARVEDLQAILFEMIDASKNAIRSIVYQSQHIDHVYAKVLGSGIIVFPYAGAPATDSLFGGTYNIQKAAGYIYVTFNPSSIDITNYKLAFENSLGKASYYYKPNASKAVPATDLVITRTQSPNGLWKIPVESITSDSIDPAQNTSETDMLYALKVNFDIDNYIYSQYAAYMTPQPATAATTLTLQVQNDTLRLGTGNARVYRKYVECIKIVDSLNNDSTATKLNSLNAANVGILQTVMPASDSGENDKLTIACPADLRGYRFTLRYYAWNYDGTILSRDIIVFFSDDNKIHEL